MHSERLDTVYSVRSIEEPPHLIRPTVGSASAPRTEELGPRHSRARRGPGFSWRPGLAGTVWFTIGCGLGLNGLAVTVARTRFAVGEWLFCAAIVIPFVVFISILLAARPSPALRKFLIAAVGLYPSVVYRLSSPLVVGGFDEHLHEQELLNLLRGSGLFAPNPMLTAGPNYPGMELFTGVVARLSDMPVMLAMSLVVLLCRLVLVLTIYNAALTVSPSARVASLTVIFYAVSPQFYFFNSQFSYQTMAVTLGLGGLFLLRRAQLADERTTSRRFWRAGILALLSVVVTHHVTSWLILAFLTSWAMVAPPGKRKLLFRTASVMGAAVACWTAVSASQLVTYLRPLLNADLKQFKAFLAGSAQRAVFAPAAGNTATPQWERAILIFYSLICTFAAIAVGVILVSRALRTRDHMLGLLSVLCLAFPLTLAAHFIPSAADLGDRASTFFFLPLALSCSLVVMRDRRVAGYVSRRRRRSSATLASLVAVTSLAYLGGVMLGAGPAWEWLPGPYLVSADPRTQDAETLAAVRWAAAHLPPGSHIAADRVPADLLESEARLWPVISPSQGLEPAWLYFSPVWTLYQTDIVRQLHVQYIYVDQRLTESLPHEGYYFYPGESPKPRHISARDITKFARVPELTISYHHGPVTIYDTGGFHVTNQPEEFAGKRNMGLGWLGDGALGVLTAGLILLLRRRLSWIGPAFAGLEGLGTAMVIMAASIFAAGVLFAFHSMPGAGFSAGLAATVLIVVIAWRLRTGRRLIPRTAPLPGLDPLVILGILAGMVGVVVSIRAAWNVDVTAVDAILRAVAQPGGR